MKINSRQAAILLAIMMFANKILVLPSLLAKNAKADSIFIVMAMFIVDILGCLCFLLVKKRYQTQSLFEILSSNIGKWLTYIIFAVLFFYFFIKICLNFNITHSYFKIQVYQKERIYIFLFCAVIVVWSFIKGGVQSLARTAEFLFIPIIAGVIFCQFISITNFKNLPFFFDAPIKMLFEDGFKYLFHFGDFLFLFLIIDKIEYSKKLGKDIFKYLAFIMIIILCGYFLYLSIFQNTAFMHINAISDLIILSYRIFEIGRLDIIAVITVMSLTFLQLGLYSVICINILTSLMPKINLALSSAFLLALFCLCYFTAFNSYDIIINFIVKIMPYFAISMQYILPLLCVLFRRRQ